MQTCPRRKLVVTPFSLQIAQSNQTIICRFVFQTGFDIFGMIDLCPVQFRMVSLYMEDAKTILSASQANPSSREVMLANSVSTSSLGQAFSPSTRIPIPNMIPAMQIKYPVTFHHASLSISCSTTRALKEFEKDVEALEDCDHKKRFILLHAFCHVWHIGHGEKDCTS